jgi:hypothetical protein
MMTSVGLGPASRSRATLLRAPVGFRKPISVASTSMPTHIILVEKYAPGFRKPAPARAVVASVVNPPEHHDPAPSTPGPKSNAPGFRKPARQMAPGPPRAPGSGHVSRRGCAPRTDWFTPRGSGNPPGKWHHPAPSTPGPKSNAPGFRKPARQMAPPPAPSTPGPKTPDSLVHAGGSGNPPGKWHPAPALKAPGGLVHAGGSGNPSGKWHHDPRPAPRVRNKNVEAAGIEPASENASAGATTCVAIARLVWPWREVDGSHRQRESVLCLAYRSIVATDRPA